MKLRQYIGIGLIIILVAGAVALVRSRPVGAPENRLKVAASYYPFYEVAAKVGGDHVVVTNLTPAGAEPHDFEPSALDLAKAQESAVFVYNGARFEPWAEAFVREYKGVVVKGSEGLELRTEPDGITPDPHYWLDPVLMQQVTETVRAALAKADPANEGYYRTQADAYKAQLAALDDKMGLSLARCQTSMIVTNHAAFHYLAYRYGLTPLAITGLSPEAEASPEQLAQLTSLVKEQGVRYIFMEKLASPKLAETLARETGAQVAVLDPVEGLSASELTAGKDYLSVQQENLGALQRALTCR
jgi:zinc transport system substrate-binding protein